MQISFRLKLIEINIQLIDFISLIFYINASLINEKYSN